VEPNPFVSTNLQTIIFPSGNRYESAQTADGVQVKMKLMITYRIIDPKLAIKQLNSPVKILEHIEYCALTDMRNATQNCNFYAVQQTEKAKAEDKNDNSQPQYYQHIQDELKVNLKQELRSIGVELGRLTFEEFLIDDKKVQEQRSSNAQAIASTTAQVSNLEKERTLRLQNEETTLQVSRIQMEQRKNQEISKAETELARTEIELKMQILIAESKAQQEAAKVRIETQNKLDMQKMTADMDYEIAKVKANSLIATANAEREILVTNLQAKGEIYERFPKLYELDMVRLQATALAGITTSVISPDVAPSYFGQLNGVPLLFQGGKK